MSTSPSPAPGPSPSRSTEVHVAADRATLIDPASNSGSEASPAEKKGVICQQQGDISQVARNTSHDLVFQDLPQDILHYIHSLLPVQDAARAACVSRGFLNSWRCYSKLILSFHTVGLTGKKFGERETNFINKVDQILENHHNNGVQVEILQLYYLSFMKIKSSHLDRWLQITVKSGIKELDLSLHIPGAKYNFPCSVLSDETTASSIQSLSLFGCAFHPTSTLGLLRKLTSLKLSHIHITDEVLGHLLSKSSALERLELSYCSEIISLRIPSTMEKLKFIRVRICQGLKVVEIDAPNLRFLCCSGAEYGGEALTEISVRNSSQLKTVILPKILLSRAHVWLPSIARNVESLTLGSHTENFRVSIMPSKFLHLKKLDIRLQQPSYDAFSLVSFLDASPVMDTFILHIEQGALRPDLDVGDDNDRYLRRKLEHRHDRLRKVEIMGFCASKSLVELTTHILENAPSLERLTLDTVYVYSRSLCTTGKCPASTKMSRCSPFYKTDLAGARRAVKVVGRYITWIVPSSVQFKVVEPCDRCNTSEVGSIFERRISRV